MQLSTVNFDNQNSLFLKDVAWQNASEVEKLLFEESHLGNIRKQASSQRRPADTFEIIFNVAELFNAAKRPISAAINEG